MFDELVRYWDKIVSVTHFEVKVGNLIGKGSVKVNILNDHTLIFEEKGTWSNGMNFFNRQKWLLKKEEQKISLAHLRLGENAPVSLVDLKQGEGILQSLEPHLCNKDCYQANLSLSNDFLCLEWSVKGPTKNINIVTKYN